MDWLNSPAEIAAVLSIVGVFLGGLTWLIRAVIRMSAEFRPNGGSSTRDQLDRIERKVDDHITWHLDRH